MTDAQAKPQDLDEIATAWVNSVVPMMYEALDKAGITYNDEMLCHALSDGFIAGYTAKQSPAARHAEALREILSQAKEAFDEGDTVAMAHIMMDARGMLNRLNSEEAQHATR